MVLQYVILGLVDASVIILGAMGLSLIYGVRKFANFSHGDMMTMGAYLALFGSSAFAGNLLAGLIFAMAVMALVGVALEYLVFRHLERRGPVAPLIASVGIALVLQNLVGFWFGGRERVYPGGIVDNWIVGPFSINPVRQLLPMLAGYSTALAIVLVLRYTKLGKAMRATADNLDLAKVAGVNTRLVTFSAWAIASALAAAGGVMLGVNQGLSLTMGFNILLLLFSAVILGGIGSVYGSMLGAIILGLADALFFPLAIAANIDTRWFLVVPFGLMVLMLIVRPSGLVGKPIGREERSVWKDLRETIRSLVPGRT